MQVLTRCFTLNLAFAYIMKLWLSGKLTKGTYKRQGLSAVAGENGGTHGAW